MTTSTLHEMAVRPTAFEVTSETDPAVVYKVQLPGCECRDFRYRRTANPRSPFCKHLLRAFEMAGWQLPASTDTSRLDWEAAADLLTDFGITKRAAEAALGRAQVSTAGSHMSIADGIAVILYSKPADTFDVRLPG
jgi:hypothetical protein